MASSMSPRQFTPAPADPLALTFAGQQTVLGAGQLFACRSLPDFILGVEICEDMWGGYPALPAAGCRGSHRHRQPVRQR